MHQSKSATPARRGPGLAAVAAMTVVLAAVAVWGFAGARDRPAATGAIVGVGDGTVQVASASLVRDPMAMMHGSTNQFAGTGMAMSSMLPDAVPDGMKRIAIELRLAAGQTPLDLPGSSARLTDPDGRTYAPYSALMGDGHLDPHAAMSGMVTFEVPDELSAALFWLEGAASPVSIDVPGSGGHGHES